MYWVIELILEGVGLFEEVEFKFIDDIGSVICCKN